MGSQETSIKHSALGWVKKAIDDNLTEIEVDLKRYIEEEADPELLGGVKERLGVIQGVLMMIEQYGAAMLTEEMVALADFIAEQKQDKSEQALEVMLRAVLQLPDYLEHIQSGHRDIPIAILPLLNDIRAVRNQDLFSEKLLFLPDLSMHQEGAQVESIDEQQNQASKLLAKKLRPVYQLALLNVIRDKSVDESLQRLEKVCETLEERSFSEQVARIWWIVGALLESVTRGQLEVGVSIKNLLGKVDALFRVILIIGERGLTRRQPIELIKNFLYYIAQPECDGPKTQAIKTAYRLEQFLPSESARSEVLDNIAGPNQALLKTVAEAMKADIEAVKSTLEVYVNGDLANVEILKDLPKEMHIISDTLAMIGLGSQRQLIEAQIVAVKDIVAGNQSAYEEQLLSMAAELLQVEQALDQMQKRQPVSEEPKSETDVSRDYELDSVLTAVVTAALDDIQKTKSAILDFIKDSSHSDNIDLCITLMEESRGALELLNQPRAVAVVDGLLAYLRGYDIVEFMESSRLDALSQVVVSLEYYLEAIGEHRSDADSILDFADVQLRELLARVKIGEAAEVVEVVAEAPPAESLPAEPTTPAEPEPAEAEVEPEPVAEVAAAPEPVAEPEDHGLTVSGLEVEEMHGPGEEAEDDDATVEQAIPGFVPTAKPVPAPFEPVAPADMVEVVAVDEELEVLKSGSDPDILEIYLEEAEEEAQSIDRLQQDWLLHPEDENALKNIRRAFHTIKGSGRLVGAIKIGEFAWDYEQLLNRVIDKTVRPSEQIIAAVGKAAKVLPDLVNELKSADAEAVDIGYLRGLARALAEFNAERVLIEHQTMTEIESPYDRITDAETDLPPDGPRDTLLEEIEPDTMQVDPALLDGAAIEVGLKSKSAPADAGEAPGREPILAQPPESAVAEDDDVTAPEPAAEARSPEDYTQAVDYAHGEDELEASPESAETFAGAAAEDGGEDEISMPGIEADDLGESDLTEFDHVPPVAEEAIEIEIVEEDFDTDISDENLTAEEIDAALEDQVNLAETLTEIKVSDVEDEVEEVVVEAPESNGEAGELIPEADELEIEEVDVEAPAPGPEDDGAESGGTPHDPFVGTTGSPVPGSEAGASESVAQEPPAPIGLSFDPELLTIYQQEVEQHLSIVSSVLDQAEQIQELIPNEKIYRALHTIHGASRTADISTIGELASLLEKPLKSAIAQNMALDHEIVALYREGQRAIRSMTEELVATRALPRIPSDLEISLKALAEDFEVHTVEIPEDEQQSTGDFIDTLTMISGTLGPEHDNELLTIFVDEANELLEVSDNTLHDWSAQQVDEAGGYDYSAVMELQRYLHTLKGGARMAELKEISDLSHEMESMFIAVIDGRVEKNDDLIELLKDCFDLLHQQVGEAQEGNPLSDSSERVSQLRELRRGDTDATADDILDEDLDVDSEDIDIVSEHLPGEPLAGLERPTQDVIKVRSDLLDNLVSSAGEVSIYRARMEQQVAGLGSYLGELGQTIARLKGQLRNLEAETDAQIHYSHRAEARGAGEFDPLEMDRYTMIQELSRSLSESVNDLSSLQGMLGEQVKDSETLLLQQSRVNTDLQDGLIKSRMVKFSGLLSRLRRLVRQSSQELGKKAELMITGEENEVDNKVLDRMVAPLEHIIRNALSHGIETPVERVKKGKPETGRIGIDITRDGSDIVIRVSDDGAGVNIEKVRSRAIQLGLLGENKQLSDADLVQFILEPGFSTAEHVTQLSGRGVGMDVVDIEIKQLGGTLQIETNPTGTTFIARLPFTLSINQAIMVRTGDETYAIPLLNIEGITRLDTPRMIEYYRQEEPEIEYAGQQFALHHLSKLVGATAHFRPTAENDKQAVILGRAGDVRVALHVDEIIGNREIVVKTLGKQLSQVKGLAGASILADGSVVLILDIGGLVRASAASAVRIVYQPDEITSARTRSTVMVVDDSITMRRVASKLLERHNFDVVTAKDGVDALAQLEDVRPDVMLLDIEMPRMDGFELATHMQNEETYSRIPIIMITSRTGEKHRDRAFEIGVTNYMGKPYQEEELIENIQSALSAAG